MSLADQIIEHGPVESHDQVPPWFEALTAAGINQLRGELIELRRLRVAVGRFTLLVHVADLDDGDDAYIEYRCTACDWTVDVSKDLALAELVRRANEHTERCA